MTTDTTVRVQSDLAIPPGELLEEELAARGMPQQEFALRTGRPPQAINEIIRGKKQITHDTALEFEKVLGISAHVWINLESEYRLAKARLRDEEELRQQRDWLKEFPVRQMEHCGWIAAMPTPEGKLRELLRFFGVASFAAWQQTVVGFRITPRSQVSTGALAAWLRKAELDGQAVETEPYDRVRFQEALAEVRGLTTESPQAFVPRVQSICAAAGTAVVFVQELPKSGANGCARWLSETKALIALSLRYKTNDHLWFSFFHEACHILRHRVRHVFIDGLDGADDSTEQEADTFARDILIPPDDWLTFVRQSQYAAPSVVKFAGSLGIAAGIVVGRLQHEGQIPYSSLNHLKVRYRWSESD